MFSRFINEIIRRRNEIGSHCKVLWFQKTFLLDLTLRLSIETNLKLYVFAFDTRLLSSRYTVLSVMILYERIFQLKMKIVIS